jgi:hypothetical protein
MMFGSHIEQYANVHPNHYSFCQPIWSLCSNDFVGWSCLSIPLKIVDNGVGVSKKKWVVKIWTTS